VIDASGIALAFAVVGAAGLLAAGLATARARTLAAVASPLCAAPGPTAT
jgi:hypothetical protein